MIFCIIISSLMGCQVGICKVRFFAPIYCAYIKIFTFTHDKTGRIKIFFNVTYFDVLDWYYEHVINNFIRSTEYE